jgi:hypothetical protein
MKYRLQLAANPTDIHKDGQKTMVQMWFDLPDDETEKFKRELIAGSSFASRPGMNAVKGNASKGEDSVPITFRLSTKKRVS